MPDLRAATPDGGEIVLTERDGVFTLRVNGRELMSSRAHASEEAMAIAAADRVVRIRAPRVLIGGLGMGFTLRAVLDTFPETATVVVCEILGAVIRWCLGPMAHVAGHALDDPRVRVVEGDVLGLIEGDDAPFHAILLDVDNGPGALSIDSNRFLYGRRSLRRLLRRLVPGGVLVVWSAAPDPDFEARLEQSGFKVEILTVPARKTGDSPCHTLFFGTRPVR